MLDGALFMPRGIGLFFKRPGLWLLGLTPVAVSAGLVLILAFVLAFLIDDFTLWVTPFADAWPVWLRGTVRVSIALAVIAAFLLGIVVTFAEVTNVVGQPFFQIISDRVEAELGNAPRSDGEWWRGLPRATTESVITFAIYLCFMIPLFVLSFVPFVGQFVVPVIGAFVSGFFLSLEILQIPLEKRGHDRLAKRVGFHRDPRYKHEVLGFGIAAFLLFLIPLANVVAMPGAIIGGTLLVRRLDGTDPAP
jgi:CysZ protein